MILPSLYFFPRFERDWPPKRAVRAQAASWSGRRAARAKDPPHFGHPTEREHFHAPSLASARRTMTSLKLSPGFRTARSRSTYFGSSHT